MEKQECVGVGGNTLSCAKLTTQHISISVRPAACRTPTVLAVQGFTAGHEYELVGTSQLMPISCSAYDKVSEHLRLEAAKYRQGKDNTTVLYLLLQKIII